MSNPKSSQGPDPKRPKSSTLKSTDLRSTELVHRGSAISIPDTVPGDPPVPITAWYLPKPRAGTKVPVTLVRRLMANYTQPGTPVVNLSGGHRLARLGTSTASLVITDWPRMVPSSSPVNETKGNGRAVDDSEVGKATARKE
jgi:hypothetical protein